MRAVGGDQAALVRKGVEKKVKKALATGKGRVPVEKRMSWQARGGCDDTRGRRVRKSAQLRANHVTQ